MESSGADSRSVSHSSDVRDREWNIRVTISSVTELPVIVSSPTFDFASAEQCTRMERTDADTCSGGDVRDRDWSRRTGESSVAELPVVAPSPTSDGATCDPCAGIVAAGADAGSSSTCAGRDIRDEDWSARVGNALITELPVVISSPTFDFASAEQCTRMGVAGADAGNGSACDGRDIRDEDWSARVGNAVIAELPVGIVSPTFDFASAEQCTRMGVTGADTGCVIDTADEDWSARVGIGPITELPVGVFSPTFDLATID